MHKTSRGKLSRDIEKECNECVRKNLTWQELPIHLKQVNNSPFVFELVNFCVCVLSLLLSTCCVSLTLSFPPFLSFTLVVQSYSRALPFFSHQTKRHDREKNVDDYKQIQIQRFENSCTAGMSAKFCVHLSKFEKKNAHPCNKMRPKQRINGTKIKKEN